MPGAPVLVLSQYVEVSYADDLLADRAGAVGYLLKDRVADDRRVPRRAATGWPPAAPCSTPRWSAQLLVRRRRDDPLRQLTPREREVLALMAEGRSNTRDRPHPGGQRRRGGEARPQHLHQADLPPDDEQHRRVLAVLTYLRG